MTTLTPKSIDRYNGKEYTLKLGKVYEVTTMGDKRSTVLFIKTSAKGFNFLHLKSAKCVHKSPLYQTNSANKTIGRLQREFDIAIPDHVIEIKQLSQEEIKKIRFLDGISFYAPDKTIKDHKLEEEKRMRIEEEWAIEENTIHDPISALEIE